MPFPTQVGFPLREGLPVSGQHCQLGLGEAERPDIDQREYHGPSHLGRGGLCFPTPGKQAGWVGEVAFVLMAALPHVLGADGLLRVGCLWG